MKTLICTLAAVCFASQALAGQENSVCSSNSDCSGVTGLFCMIPSPCRTGWCKCPKGQTTMQSSGTYGNTCQTPTASTTTAVKLGAPCSRDADCTGYPTATCQNSQCQCIPSRTPAQDGIRCQPFNKGAQCSASNNAVCGTTGNGDCSSGTCACFSGYTWATSGDIDQPGGCVSTSSTINVGQGQACTVGWASQSPSNAKICSANNFCATCPEGGSYCMSGAASVAVVMPTLVLAVVCSLMLGL